MPNKLSEVWYEFHPVGQGLFASGFITYSRNRMRFNWVYDCGTSSIAPILDRAIASYLSDAHNQPSPGNATKPHLDLLVISHFDEDHVSGMTRIIEHFTIGTLLLPYIPLWQRLVLALIEGVWPGDPLMQFCRNPVAYVTSMEGAKIERIVFVGGGGGEPEPVEGVRSDKGPESDLDRLVLEYPREEPQDKNQQYEFEMFHKMAGGGTSIELLRRGANLRLSNLWEFMPYNDAMYLPKATEEFIASVSAEQTRLLDPRPGEDLYKLLEGIKGLYDETFGGSSVPRNLISLFLYAGPLSPSDRSTPWGLRQIEAGYSRSSDGSVIHDLVYVVSEDPMVYGTLYTGDGYLNRPARLGDLVKFYGKERIGRLLCLQVMHHGARGNWHAGVARALSPKISVFSSDPTRRRPGHPHAEVVRDFLPFYPVQVDSTKGLVIWARFE